LCHGSTGLPTSFQYLPIAAFPDAQWRTHIALDRVVRRTADGRIPATTRLAPATPANAEPARAAVSLLLRALPRG
jgi:hypothetical protein